MDSPAPAFAEGETGPAAELSSTSFLTPATNPAIPSTGRHSIDFSEKAPQVMEWTSALSNQVVDIPALSSSASDHAPSTPTLSSMDVDHDADLEELHMLTPTLVEVPAPDIPLQNLTLSGGPNPTYLSTKPYSVSGHYAKGLDGYSIGVPSPPSSIIAEPPSPTLSHASLKLGSNYSSTSSNPGEEHEQELDQAMDQDEDQRSQDATSQTSERKVESVAGDHGDHNSTFMVPRREILTKEDLELFHGSETYANLFEFLEALNESVVGVVSTAECHQSEVRDRILVDPLCCQVDRPAFFLFLSNR